MPRTHLTYDSVDEATNRLHGTIVTYDGAPVRVMGVEAHADGILRLQIASFPYNGEVTRKTINSPAFKRFQTPPLGYCNYFHPGTNNHALWCERMSNRTRRQGLCDEVFNAVAPTTGWRMPFDRLSRTDAFREMVMGEYPAFDDVVERLVPNSSIAVDRDFAVERGADGFTKLVWRRETIALVVRDGIMLRADRQHLRETIADCRNLPNRVELL